MFTAMTAADNIIAGQTDKNDIWRVNTEEVSLKVNSTK
jgi:hypothetical protein